MQVGRYQILEFIGAGTHSRVARGFDPMIGRTVAIKLLSSPELAHGEARQRFIQEARVIGQISHPNIIALHDMGIEESSSTPYLVLEYIEGPALDRLLDKGTLPYARACAIIADMAAALHAAHRKGVIHGDVKPANILITEEGRPKLSDFGMARLSRADSGGSPLLGTPAYWCPEQILGKSQDARSDLFSLGVVLYEMVTGNRPFDAGSLQDVCSRVLSSTPLLPSRANSSLPASFDEIMTRCLAKDPAARFASGEILAENLYPLARRKMPTQVAPPPSGLRERAARLLRSA